MDNHPRGSTIKKQSKNKTFSVPIYSVVKTPSNHSKIADSQQNINLKKRSPSNRALNS
jgi:hypothetical protein